MRRPLRPRDGRKASSVSGPPGRSDCFRAGVFTKGWIGVQPQGKDRLQEASREQTVTTANQENTARTALSEISKRDGSSLVAQDAAAPRDFQGMTPVSNGVEKKTAPSDSWSPGARCTIGAPSARISLVRLRPRRAGLRFSGHLQSTIYWHDLRQEAPLKSGVQKIPRPKNRQQALDTTGSFRDGSVGALGGKPPRATGPFFRAVPDPFPPSLDLAVRRATEQLPTMVFALRCRG